MRTHVHVGIPTLNGPDRLDRALSAITKCTPFSKYDLIIHVVDDCSTEDNRIKNREVIRFYGGLQEWVSLRLMQNEARRGIAASWNRLVKERKADVYVLLNDDVEVVDDWLDVLVYSVVNNPHAGMIALNSYVALTKLQHEMTLRFADLERKTGAQGPQPMHALWPRVDYVEARLMGDERLLASSGCAFAFSRAAYEAIGGFDERYFCFYEELDFGTALRTIGYRHYIASYPIVYHMGGATNSNRGNLDASVELHKSRAAYLEKWGGSPQAMREKLANTPHHGNLSGKYPPLREWNSSLRNVDE